MTTVSRRQICHSITGKKFHLPTHSVTRLWGAADTNNLYDVISSKNPQVYPDKYSFIVGYCITTVPPLPVGAARKGCTLLPN